MSLDSISFIQGISLGIEFVDEIPDENIKNSIVIDFFFFRFVFAIGK